MDQLAIITHKRIEWNCRRSDMQYHTVCGLTTTSVMAHDSTIIDDTNNIILVYHWKKVTCPHMFE